MFIITSVCAGSQAPFVATVDTGQKAWTNES